MLDPKLRSRLAGLAGSLPALARLGKGGASPAFIAQLARILAQHELVKLRFVGGKEGAEDLARDLASKTGSDLVRVMGNTAVFWKRNPAPEKRKVEL
jgi:RNA-binding protein